MTRKSLYHEEPETHLDASIAEVQTRQFSVSKHATRLLVAEASDLQLGPGHRADRLVLVNTRGQKAMFVCYKTDTSPDGEVGGWHYRAENWRELTRENLWTLLVIND
jgi:hypothetical protein